MSERLWILVVIDWYLTENQCCKFISVKSVIKKYVILRKDTNKKKKKCFFSGRTTKRGGGKHP